MVEPSPSGKYILTILKKENVPGCWGYTTGIVQVGNKTISVVDRNYSSFPFLWVEDHPDGHDYLLCGEDYQGQTVIQLDTDSRKDYLPEEAKKGHAFCWSNYTFDPATEILVVDGCHWACPYEYRLYDFSSPMDGWPLMSGDFYIDSGENPPSFAPDGTITCYETSYEGDYECCPDEDMGCECKPPVVASTTFKRDGDELVLVSEWVDADEKVRRDENKARQEKYEADWALYKKTDPMYLRVVERVNSGDNFVTTGHFSVGGTYNGWCPHFSGDEGRVCRDLKPAGSRADVSFSLEWGKKTAPVKLVCYRNGKRTKDLWFDHSVKGIDTAMDKAVSLSSPGLFSILRNYIPWTNNGR